MILQITYTNIIIINSQEITFSELSEEQKQKVANYMRRVPLETLGEVNKRNTA